MPSFNRCKQHQGPDDLTCDCDELAMLRANTLPAEIVAAVRAYQAIAKTFTLAGGYEKSVAYDRVVAAEKEMMLAIDAEPLAEAYAAIEADAKERG